MMATDPLIGAVLGNYRIANLLSSGGMGSVYRAKHALLGRDVAIKFLRPDLTTSDELVQRFFNEAKAATAIQHPGIVEVYDFGYTEDGHAYYVMELLDGKPLSRAIAERGRFDEAQAVRIALGIASALESAHARGIVHRDLKPDNIFLVPTGHDLRVKVLDFGIAKLANLDDARHRTRTGVLLGTPKYMAPEQAREAAKIDARADLYSLGCVIYEMLVGQPPFVADGAGEIIAMQLFTEPEAPATRATVSPALSELVMRLLAKEAADRPQSAGVVRRLLGGRSSEPVIEAPPMVDVVAPITPMPAPRRSALPFVLAGLAALVVAGTAVFFATRSEPAAPKPLPPAPVAVPKPAVVEITPTPAPAPAPPAPMVVKTKPGAKGARIAKPAAAPPKLETDNHSPIEVDVGELRPPKPP
jgi:eukaryotic-like serine/threonine-protein kinase